MPAFNEELAARVLIEASISGDKVAAQKYDVEERTVRNYRARLETDPHFSAFFRLKQKETQDAWVSGLTPAIMAGIDFLQRAAQNLEPKDPEAVKAVTESVRVLSELAITTKVINARYAGED